MPVGPGAVAILTEDLTPISVREPCEIEWDTGSGSRYEVKFLSKHDLTLSDDGEAFFVGIYTSTDDDAPLWYLLPIVGRPIDSASMMVGY